MFVIYVIDSSAKSKMERRGSIILQKYKIQTVGNRKKKVSVISSQKFLIPNIRFFRKCSMFRQSIPLIKQFYISKEKF